MTNIPKYAPLYDSACYAIGSNGFQILKMPKYASVIVETRVKTLSGGMVSVTWVDRFERIIAEGTGLREWYPMIGKVVEA